MGSWFWHVAWFFSSCIVLYLQKFEKICKKVTDFFQIKSLGPHRFTGEVIDLGVDKATGSYIVVLRLEKGHPTLLQQGLEKTGQKVVFTTEMQREITPAEQEAAETLAYTMKKAGFNIGEQHAE
jgi:hypothetical protein